MDWKISGPGVQAFAPATVSNLGPGYDCLGLALSCVGDTVRVRRREQPGVGLVGIVGDGGRLPKDTHKNTATASVAALLADHAPDQGVEVELRKGLPLGSGLGSSGASACAALVGVNRLLGLNLGVDPLVEYARQAEAIACGSAHADNVAPCIAGGVALVASEDPLRVVSLPTPEDLHVVAYTPGCEIRTADARAVLPTSIPVSTWVRQSARLALLVHALHSNDLPALGEAIFDEVVEPARCSLIPGFLAAKAACLEAGAIACSISGAGPTTFALASDAQRAQSLLEILDESFTRAKVPGKGFVDTVGKGAHATELV